MITIGYSGWFPNIPYAGRPDSLPVASYRIDMDLSVEAGPRFVSRGLQFALQRALDHVAMHIAHGAPVAIETIERLVDGIATIVDAKYAPTGRASPTHALNEVQAALIDQASGKAVIPTLSPPEDGTATRTSAKKLIVMTFANEAYTRLLELRSTSQQIWRRRLSALLSRVGTTENDLRDFRRNLQRKSGSRRAERGAIHLSRQVRYPRHKVTTEQRLAWVFDKLENAVVSMSFSQPTETIE
jgi:hypothetical protein